jgi:hypothetical protein
MVWALLDVARALQHLHAMHVLHGDVKVRPRPPLPPLTAQSPCSTEALLLDNLIACRVAADGWQFVASNARCICVGCWGVTRRRGVPTPGAPSGRRACSHASHSILCSSSPLRRTHTHTHTHTLRAKPTTHPRRQLDNVLIKTEPSCPRGFVCKVCSARVSGIANIWLLRLTRLQY